MPCQKVLTILLSCLLSSAAALRLAASSASHGEAEKSAPAELSTAAQAKIEAGRISTRPSEDHIEIVTNKTGQISNLNHGSELNKYQLALETARKLHESQEFERAETQLVQILEGRFPDEVKRPALLELGLVMQEQHSYAKAQQLFTEYVRRYDKDPRVPEVLLRQGYLYREMGVPQLALSKFYAVMSTCLNLKLEEMDYYKKLVLRAQAEIAQTYFLQGKFNEASDYYNRLLRLETQDLDRADVLYHLVRCYMNLDKFSEAAANARLYLQKYGDGLDAPETRFMLANSLKKLGQTKESLQEMDLLLSKQFSSASANPQQWLYWQQRAGNDIANQLYQEADFVSALQVYSALAKLNDTPEWQIPVWYQIGLVYENLKQEPKAVEMYDRILTRIKALADKQPNASTKAVSEMAAWRKNYLAWEEKARVVNQQLQATTGTNSAGL